MTSRFPSPAWAWLFAVGGNAYGGILHVAISRALSVLGKYAISLTTKRQADWEIRADSPADEARRSYSQCARGCNWDWG